MITYTNIVVEIERQVKQAQAKNNEEGMKEALIAIQALCNVALREEEQKTVRSESKHVSLVSSNNTNNVMKVEQSYSQNNSDDSIFDF